MLTLFMWRFSEDLVAMHKEYELCVKIPIVVCGWRLF